MRINNNNNLPSLEGFVIWFVIVGDGTTANVSNSSAKKIKEGCFTTPGWSH